MWGLRTELRVSLKRTWETRLQEIAKLIPLRDLTFDPALGSGDDEWLPGAIDGGILGQIETLSQRTHASPVALPKLLARRGFVHLRRIALDGNPHANALFIALSTGEHLGELEVLDLKRYDYSDMQPEYHLNVIRNLRILRVGVGGYIEHYPGLPLILPFAAEPMSRLAELALIHTIDTDDCAQVLGRGNGVGSELSTLTLCSGALSARGACDILGSVSLPALQNLDISGNVLGDLVGKRLQMAKHYPKLESLDARNTHLSADGIAALAHWPGFVGLRKLALSGNGFNHNSMRALTTADSPNLRTLGLANCELHGSHIRELVTAPFVRSLWSLDLRGNPFDDAAARALASSPFLDELQCLHLDLPADDPNLPRLRERFGNRLM